MDTLDEATVSKMPKFDKLAAVQDFVIPLTANINDISKMVVTELKALQFLEILNLANGPFSCEGCGSEMNIQVCITLPV